MLKSIKSLLATALITLPLLSHADTCPTPLELRAGNYNNWKLLDLDNATPLSSAATQRFQHQVRSFALAEWMASAPEGSGHCYYEGITPDSTYLGAFLAKDNPKPTSKAWRQMNPDVMQCNADIRLCTFDT